MGSQFLIFCLLACPWARANDIYDTFFNGGQQKDSQLSLCPTGSFGDLCEHDCHCRDNESCLSDGHCPAGCSPSYQPPNCTVCLEGFFGPHCAGQCHCMKGPADCHKGTGRCTSGACSLGYEGDTCQKFTGFPRIKSLGSDDIVDVNQEFLVTCTAEGLPTPSIAINSSTIKAISEVRSMGPNEIAVEMMANVSKGVHQLNCVASNQHGSANHSFPISVVEPPVLVDPPEVKAKGLNEMTVSWKPWQYGHDLGGHAHDAPQYLVVYRLVEQPNWQKASNAWQSATSAAVTSLEPDSDYVFAVRSRRNSELGVGGPGPAAQGVTPCVPPSHNATPQHLTSKIISPTVVQLNWMPPNHSDLGCGTFHYNLVHVTTNGSSPNPIRLEQSSNSHVLKDLLPRTRYTWRLSAQTKLGTAPSADFRFDTTEFISEPVENLTVHSSPSHPRTITLSWSPPAAIQKSEEQYLNYTAKAELVSIKACKSIPSGSPTLTTIRTTLTQATFEELFPFSRYLFSVNVQTAGGLSDLMEEQTQTAEGIPERPGEVSANISASNTLSFSWREIPCHKVNGRLLGYRYTLQRVDKGSQKRRKRDAGYQVLKGETKGTNVTIGNLTANAEYEFSLTGYTSAGDSPPVTIVQQLFHNGSDEMSISLEDVGARHLSLSWLHDAAGNDTAFNYTVYAQLMAMHACQQSSSDVISSVLTNTSRTNVTLFGLSPFSAYNVSVYGFSDDESKEAFGHLLVNTSQAAPSGPPLSVSPVEARPTRLGIKWRPIDCRQLNGQLLGYKVSLRQVRGRNDSWVEKDKETSGTQETFEGLSAYTWYELRVRGFTQAGDGPPALYVRRTLDEVSFPPTLELLGANSTALAVRIRPPTPINGLIEAYEVKLTLGTYQRMRNMTMEESLAESAVEYVEESLAPFTTYQLQAKAKNKEHVWGEWSAVYSFSTDEGVPDKPRINYIRALNSTTVQLQWSPPTNTTGISYVIGYLVKHFQVRKDFTYSNETLYRVKSNTSTLANFTGFVVGSLYTFQVAALSRGGVGEFASWTEEMSTELGIMSDNGRAAVQSAPPPPAPQIVKIEEQANSQEVSMDILIFPVNSSSYPHQPEYYDVVVMDQRLFQGQDLNHTNIGGYKTEATANPPYWIAARISAHQLPTDGVLMFVVGDKTFQNGYYNGPLHCNSTYVVMIGVHGQDFKSDLSPMVFSSSDKSTGDSTFVGSCLILGIPCLWFFVMLAVAIILFWVILAVICYCRITRRRKKKLSISEGSLRAENRLNNIWPKSSENRHTISGEEDTNLTLLPSSSSIQAGTTKTFNKNCNFFGPIPVRDLSDYISQRLLNPKIDFQEEFKQATRDKLKPWTVAKRPENLKKNRYGNILPYDMTRVRLEPLSGQPDTDYINASFVDGYDKPKVYIATQGPKDNTVQDFWRMIWQENIAVVVMLTGLVESKKKKCEQYWPNHSHLYGNVLVTLTGAEHLADIVIRHFEVKTIESAEIKEVTHYHYLDWPDQALPPCVTSLLNLRRKVREEVQKRGSRSPIVVHCNGGAGRTGAFIAIDAMLNQAYEEERVHVFKHVGAMWGCRSNLIQNAEQYRFVYDAVLEALQSGDTKVLCSRLPIYYRSICRTSECEPSDLAEQFNILNRLERRSSCYSCPEALSDENSLKNRSRDILPVEHSRVRLQSIYEPVFEEDETLEELPAPRHDPYINAVLCDGYKQKGQFLVTHMPLDDTVQDFWRMVVLHRSSVIVMLNDCEFIDENTVPGQYWPNEGCIQYGPYQVEVVTFEEMGMVTMRTLRVVDTRKAEHFMPLRVMQLQFLDWVPEKTVPGSVSSILSLICIADVLKSKYGGPVTVHCQDGASRCGVFCASHVVREQTQSGEVDIFQTIKRLRRHRPQFITSMEQYNFCYEVAMASLAVDEANKEIRLVTLV